MRFLILRVLTHSELGMFHEYRRQKLEGSKQRAVNFDADVVDRVFPAAKDSDRIVMDLRYATDGPSIRTKRHWLRRQEKNWRLEGNCPTDKCYRFVRPGCLFAMDVDAGRSPAVGSWAVFPANHPVTGAIRSDAESSRLSESAMIALFGEEGSRSRRVLARHCPELFSDCDEATVPQRSVRRPSDNGTELLVPNPSRLVALLAAVGYDLPSAVADLVDNAIAADAANVSIRFDRPDDGHGRWMVVSDDGNGMSRERLTEAMRIGSEREYGENDLGKYGYGLKGASWSQADRVSVVTREEGKRPCHLTWDRAHLASVNRWEALTTPLQTWEAEATTVAKHGTSVLWTNMRPPERVPVQKGVEPHLVEVAGLERHLALVFHRFLEGKATGRKRLRMTINGRNVEPNNPVGHALTHHYDRKEIRIPVAEGYGTVRVQAFVLPSEDEIRKHHLADGQDAVRRALDVISLHGRRNETQGLFVYRSDRLIMYGGWAGMMTPDEKTKLVRVVVDFSQVLDDALKVNISKKSVILPLTLKEELKRVIKDPRAESRQKYRSEMRPGKPSKSGQPAPGWNSACPRAGSSIQADGSGVAAEGVSAGRSAVPGSGGTSGPSLRSSTPSCGATVRQVRTENFVWRVQDGFMGREVQVSDSAPHLAALASAIGGNPSAVALLAEFLKWLDGLEVQQTWLQRRTGR
jgi:hypothetical protein